MFPWVWYLVKEDGELDIIRMKVSPTLHEDLTDRDHEAWATFIAAAQMYQELEQTEL